MLRASFQQIADALTAGELVCIFPEGRLTPDGQVQRFKTGVEKILRDTPVQVIPMALKGLWGSLFSRERGVAILKRPRRFWSKVELEIAPPVPPEGITADRLQESVTRLLVRQT